jgi:hypothetical protein
LFGRKGGEKVVGRKLPGRECRDFWQSFSEELTRTQKGSGSFTNENREPPFGIEKADMERSLGGSFSRPSSRRRDSVEVSRW